MMTVSRVHTIFFCLVATLTTPFSSAGFASAISAVATTTTLRTTNIAARADTESANPNPMKETDALKKTSLVSTTDDLSQKVITKSTTLRRATPAIISTVELHRRTTLSSTTTNASTTPQVKPASLTLTKSNGSPNTHLSSTKPQSTSTSTAFRAYAPGFRKTSNTKGTTASSAIGPFPTTITATKKFFTFSNIEDDTIWSVIGIIACTTVLIVLSIGICIHLIHVIQKWKIRRKQSSSEATDTNVGKSVDP